MTWPSGITTVTIGIAGSRILCSVFVDTSGRIVRNRLFFWDGTQWLPITPRHFDHDLGQWVATDSRLKAFDPVTDQWLSLVVT